MLHEVKPRLTGTLGKSSSLKAWAGLFAFQTTPVHILQSTLLRVLAISAASPMVQCGAVTSVGWDELETIGQRNMGPGVE